MKCKRCDFNGDFAEHWQETGHPRCVICTRSLRLDETQTCLDCTSRVRGWLNELLDAYPEIPATFRAGGIKGRLHINALAMEADGNAAGLKPYVTKGATTIRPAVSYGTMVGETIHHPAYTTAPTRTPGTEHYADHWPSDPSSVLASLENNERDWRQTFGHAPAVDVATITGCATYLNRWLDTAARQHPGFDDFAEELRSLRSKAQHITGLANDPVVAAAHCFDCGGDLIRDYRPPIANVTHTRLGNAYEGLPDEWCCRQCAGLYPPQTYYLAIRAALEARAASA